MAKMLSSCTKLKLDKKKQAKDGRHSFSGAFTVYLIPLVALRMLSTLGTCVCLKMLF